MRRFAKLLGQSAPWRWHQAATDGAWNEAGSFPASPLRHSSGAVASGAISAGISEVDFPRPLHTEWAWRPELWSVSVAPSAIESFSSGASFGAQTKLFHDCRQGACSARQVGVSDGPAPFTLDVDVHAFDGDFLSVAIDLPEEALAKLTRDRILRVAARCGDERSEIFVRLNLRCGPNAEHLVQRLDAGQDSHLDLDLAELKHVDDAATSAWVDVIFETPREDSICLHDLTFTLRPRAAF